MCGIAGYFRNSVPADQNVLNAMADKLIRRGPDACGFHLDGGLGLVHRRLSIIDLSGGIQPMVSADGQTVLIYNGEIFNYRELRIELKLFGHEFRTGSDTEVLLELYRRYGLSMLEKLNGFFAFAVYDKKRNKLFLVRDRLGIKPLFYFQKNGCFGFASRIDALQQIPGFPGESADPRSVRDFLCFQYIPGNRTVFPDVFRVPPASWMEFSLDTGKLRSGIWWHSDYQKKTEMPFEEAAKTLNLLLTDSVRRRMVADVPVGVYLSGGLDSCITAGLAAETAEKPLHCFTIGFQDPAYDESGYAKEAAEHLRPFAKSGLTHEIRMVEPADFSLLETLSAECGEPWADASMLPAAMLAKFARESVTVALSGDGADELFAGYERYRAMKMIHQFFRFTPGFLTRSAAGFIPDSGERTKSGRIRRFLTAAGMKPGQRYLFLMTHHAERMLDGISGEAMKGLPSPGWSWTDGTSADPAERWMELDLHTYLPDDILVKADVCSMASSLELRSPFLDFRVVQFANSLPLDYKLRGKCRKRILTEAFRRFLPPGLAARPKRGFGIPMAQWFRTVWNQPLKEHLLNNTALTAGGLVSRSGVERLIREHESGVCDNSYMLFSLLMLALFSERFSGKK